MSKDYIDLIGHFDRVVDRSYFRKRKSDFLDAGTKSQNSRIFIFDDSVDEFPFNYQVGEAFNSFENIRLYNKLAKEGKGIAEDAGILDAIKKLV